MIFITYVERVLEAGKDDRGSVYLGEKRIDTLRFSDDIDQLEEQAQDLQGSLANAIEATEPEYINKYVS